MKIKNITRILPALCFLFAMGATVQAQNMAIGVKLGANYNYVVNAVEDQEFEVGPQLGLQFMYSSDVNWGFGVEAMWTRKEVTTIPAQFGTDFRVGYIEVPVLGYYFFGELEDKVRPKIYAGPAFSLKINETDHIGEDYINGFDLGATVGTGLNIDLGSAIWLTMDLRHNFGLIDIKEDDQPAFKGAEDRWSNATTSAQIGIMVGF